MAKVRVYEYAKAIDVSSKDIIAALKDMNVEVNNHMATLEDDTVKKLDAIYKKPKQKRQLTRNPQNKKTII
ncbi:translation initiation factor IF-2 N-terminal domain-containing protein [Bacillus sp. B6(2022)]|nr:translation initiation factor IF-2 N-terminal domain-containing protein [Bacillus sp. B6(2022)]